MTHTSVCCSIATSTQQMGNKMSDNKKYTQEELDIALLKNNDSHLFKTLDRLESHQKWLLGIVSSGFMGLLGLMAHGFKWIV